MSKEHEALDKILKFIDLKIEACGSFKDGRGCAKVGDGVRLEIAGDEMMTWIKCTDRMPPNMEPVMVTMTDGCKITVLPCCRWNNKYNEWDMLNDWNWEEWLALGKKEKVTHWMPWPGPAED